MQLVKQGQDLHGAECGQQVTVVAGAGAKAAIVRVETRQHLHAAPPAATQLRYGVLVELAAGYVSADVLCVCRLLMCKAACQQCSSSSSSNRAALTHSRILAESIWSSRPMRAIAVRPQYMPLIQKCSVATCSSLSAPCCESVRAHKPLWCWLKDVAD